MRPADKSINLDAGERKGTSPAAIRLLSIQQSLPWCWEIFLLETELKTFWSKEVVWKFLKVFVLSDGKKTQIKTFFLLLCSKSQSSFFPEKKQFHF